MGLERIMLCLLLSMLAAACAREDSLSCSDDERYAGAASVPPLRIPDDLTVPDETDVLRIPDESVGREAPIEPPCLESPPDFFQGETEEG